ncbi:MAG: hypothetical protein V1779_16055 [bacterium]
MKLISQILIISCCLAAGCDLFSTRTPEPPDAGRSGFLPPTTATIVLTNFKNAIKEKNSENFLACLSDSTTGDQSYVYIPSTEAMAKFPGKFNDWNKNSEQRSYNSILAAIKEEQIPELIFKTGFNDFEILTSDSAVFYSDYYLLIPHSKEAVPTEFEGTIQFTINLSKQRWSITRWIDISSLEDSAKYSWSILKANFSD